MDTFGAKIAIFWTTLIAMWMYYLIPTTEFFITRMMMIDLVLCIVAVDTWLVSWISKRGGFLKENLFSPWN